MVSFWWSSWNFFWSIFCCRNSTGRRVSSSSWNSNVLIEQIDIRSFLSLIGLVFGTLFRCLDSSVQGLVHLLPVILRNRQFAYAWLCCCMFFRVIWNFLLRIFTWDNVFFLKIDTCFAVFLRYSVSWSLSVFIFSLETGKDVRELKVFLAIKRKRPKRSMSDRIFWYFGKSESTPFQFLSWFLLMWILKRKEDWTMHKRISERRLSQYRVHIEADPRDRIFSIDQQNHKISLSHLQVQVHSRQDNCAAFSALFRPSFSSRFPKNGSPWQNTNTRRSGNVNIFINDFFPKRSFTGTV